MHLRFLHVYSWLDSAFFFKVVNNICLDLTQFFNPLPYRQTSLLLPSFGNYELSCYRHSCAGFFGVYISFQLLWVNTKEYSFWIVCWEYISFCKKPPNCLPKGLYHLTFLPTTYESFCCSTSLSAFGVVIIQDCGHSKRHVVVSYFSFVFIWWHRMWTIFSYANLPSLYLHLLWWGIC